MVNIMIYYMVFVEYLFVHETISKTGKTFLKYENRTINDLKSNITISYEICLLNWYYDTYFTWHAMLL